MGTRTQFINAQAINSKAKRKKNGKGTHFSRADKLSVV